MKIHSKFTIICLLLISKTQKLLVCADVDDLVDFDDEFVDENEVLVENYDNFFPDDVDFDDYNNENSTNADCADDCWKMVEDDAIINQFRVTTNLAKKSEDDEDWPFNFVDVEDDADQLQVTANLAKNYYTTSYLDSLKECTLKELSELNFEYCKSPEKKVNIMSQNYRIYPIINQDLQTIYYMLNISRFSTQSSWFDRAAFVLLKSPYSEQSDHWKYLQDIINGQKAINKIRPTLQYAYYSSFNINNLESNEYNNLSAVEIVKSGKKTNITSQIQKLKTDCEEIILETQHFFSNYSADLFRIFQSYHLLFRRFYGFYRMSPEQKNLYDARLYLKSELETTALNVSKIID